MGVSSFKHRFFNSKIVFIVCLFILFFFSINLAKEIINRQGLNQEINDFKAQITSLNQDNVELGVLIEKFKNLGFIEEEARTKLSLKKPGENVLIVPENSMSEQNSLIPLNNFENNKNQTTTNPQKWLNYFFNNNLSL